MTISELYEWTRQNGYENFSISIGYLEPEKGYVCTLLSTTDSAITVEDGIIYIDV